MKHPRLVLVVLVSVIALCLFTWSAIGQDPVKVSPKNFKVLFENDRVRVLEYTAPKGEKVALHSHPANLVYALAPGHTRFTLPDGKTKELDLKKGEVVWSDGGPHSQESVTDTHVLQIELKK